MRRPSGQLAPAPSDLRILNIATEHVRKHGVERLTITRVAQDAAMSHANVYRFYPSKTALIDEITGHWLRPLEASLRVIVEAPDPAGDKFERLVFAIHRAYRDKAENDANVYALFARAVEEDSSLIQRHRGRCHLEIQRVIDEGWGGSLFEGGSQQRAVIFALDALHRFLEPLSVRADLEVARGQLERRAGRLIRIVLRAIERKQY